MPPNHDDSTSPRSSTATARRNRRNNNSRQVRKRPVISTPPTSLTVNSSSKRARRQHTQNTSSRRRIANGSRYGWRVRSNSPDSDDDIFDDEADEIHPPVARVRRGGTGRGIRQNSISSLDVGARQQRAENRTFGMTNFQSRSPGSNNQSVRSQHSDDASDGYRTPTPTETSEGDSDFLNAGFIGRFSTSTPRVRRISYQSSPECTPEPPSNRGYAINDHASDAEDNNGNDSPLISSQRHRRILTRSATANHHNASLRGGTTAMNVQPARLEENHDDTNYDETENLSVIGGRRRRRKRVISLQSTPDASPTHTNTTENRGQLTETSRSSSVEILNADDTIVIPQTPPSSRSGRRRASGRNESRHGDALFDNDNSVVVMERREEERDGSSSDVHLPETPPPPRLRTGRFDRHVGASLGHSPESEEWESNMGHRFTGITSWQEGASTNRISNASPLTSRISPRSRNISATNRSNNTNSLVDAPRTGALGLRSLANIISTGNSPLSDGASSGIHRTRQIGLPALGTNYIRYRNHPPVLLSDSTDEDDHDGNHIRSDSVGRRINTAEIANANGRQPRASRSNALINNDGSFGEQQQQQQQTAVAVGRSNQTALDSDLGTLSTHTNGITASNPTRNLNFNSSYYIRNQVLNELSPRTRLTIEELLAEDEGQEDVAGRDDQRVDRDLPAGLRAERAIPRTYGMLNLARPQRAVAVRAAELSRRNRNQATSLLGSLRDRANNRRRITPMMQNVELASSSSDSDSSAGEGEMNSGDNNGMTNSTYGDDIQIFGDEHPSEHGAAADRLRQELDDYQLALRIATEMEDDIISSFNQAADRPDSTTSRSRYSRRGSNSGGISRRSGEQFRNQRPLAPGEHCVICYEEEPDEPVGCLRCKQLIGCRRCILKWRRTNNISELNRRSPLSMGCSSVNHRKCPLCRAEWYVEPEIAPWDELRTD